MYAVRHIGDCETPDLASTASTSSRRRIRASIDTRLLTESVRLRPAMPVPSGVSELSTDSCSSSAVSEPERSELPELPAPTDSFSSAKKRSGSVVGGAWAGSDENEDKDEEELPCNRAGDGTSDDEPQVSEFALAATAPLSWDVHAGMVSWLDVDEEDDSIEVDVVVATRGDSSADDVPESSLTVRVVPINASRPSEVECECELEGSWRRTAIGGVGKHVIDGGESEERELDELLLPWTADEPER